MHISEILLEEENYKIFVDLDGVLADFNAGMKKLVHGYDETKADSDPKMKKRMWAAVSKYSKEGGKVWGELPLMKDAMKLWEYVSKYPNTEILTATGNPIHGAEEQKRDWVKRHFGNVKVNVVRLSKDKALYAKPNHILIDDREKSIIPWVEVGGIGILHSDANSTIEQLKKLGL